MAIRRVTQLMMGNCGRRHRHVNISDSLKVCGRNVSVVLLSVAEETVMTTEKGALGSCPALPRLYDLT